MTFTVSARSLIPSCFETFSYALQRTMRCMYRLPHPLLSWRHIRLLQTSEDKQLYDQLRASHTLLRQWMGSTIYHPGKTSKVTGVQRNLDSGENKLIKSIITSFRELEGGFFKQIRRAMDSLEIIIKTSQDEADEPGEAKKPEPEAPAPDAPAEGRFDIDQLDQADAAFVDMSDALLVRDLLTPDHPRFKELVAARLGPVLTIIHCSVMGVCAVFPTLGIVDLLRREDAFKTHLNHLVHLAHQFIRGSLPLIEYALSFDKDFLTANLRNRTTDGLDTPGRDFCFTDLSAIVRSVDVLHLLFSAVDVHLFPKAIQAHSMGVKAFAVSKRYPDCVVTGSYDSTVHIHNMTTGECLGELHGHRSLVTAVLMTSDGRLIISASFDHSIRVWNAFSGACLHLLRDAHSDGILAADMSSDDRYLVTGGMDKVGALWDVRQSKFLRLLPGHTHWLRAVRFAPDGRTFATGGLDGKVLIWSVDALLSSAANKSEPLRIIPAHTDYVLDLVFGGIGDRPLLASAARDGTIKLWDYTTGETVGAPMRPSSWALSIAFSPDGRVLAAGSLDSTISLYQTATQDLLRQLKVHNDGALCIQFQGRQLLISTADGQLQIVDAL